MSTMPANIGSHPGHQQGLREESPTPGQSYRQSDIEAWWAGQVKSSTSDVEPAATQQA